MPVRRFRSVEEMPPPPPLPPLSAKALESACNLSELAWRLHPVRRAPGVLRFHSVEEANASRARWEKAAVRVQQ